MHDQDDALNIKVILLGVGGAAAAALLLALARHNGEKTPEAQIEDLTARAEDVVADTAAETTQGVKKAEKAAKKKRKALMDKAVEKGKRVASDAQETAAQLEVDAKAAERDLKAAAWDAQQEAREAESRLRAAGHRVVDDATHLASWFGTEARNLAGEGKEKIAQLRHREDAEPVDDDEVTRLRAEIEDLKDQLGKVGHRVEKDYRGLTSRFAGKSGPLAELMASQATSAALEQMERSLRAKAPALLAARNRGQVVDILQKEFGPTLRETATQVAIAALGKWESGRRGGDALEVARDRARHVTDEARDMAHEMGEAARERAEHVEDVTREVARKVTHQAESVEPNGKRRFWQVSKDAPDTVKDAADAIEKPDETGAAQDLKEDRGGKAGLFWSGAGIGLALYALLDEERREKVLRFANEASVQVQELVRDLQGYDDEF